MTVMGILGALLGSKAAQQQAYAEWETERGHAKIVALMWERQLNGIKAQYVKHNVVAPDIQWLVTMAETAINLHSEKYQLTTRTKSNIL